MIKFKEISKKNFPTGSYMYTSTFSYTTVFKEVSLLSHVPVQTLSFSVLYSKILIIFLHKISINFTHLPVLIEMLLAISDISL